MYKQLIIARKDLKMSPGKLAAQVAHASMAFLTNVIKDCVTCCQSEAGFDKPYSYIATLDIDSKLYEEWINGSFTKIVCGARNRDKLMEAVIAAEAMGWNEGKEYFLIRDNCLTELEPEDEDGRTLTCIGFRPMEAEEIDKIGKRYHLF